MRLCGLCSEYMVGILVSIVCCKNYIYCRKACSCTNDRTTNYWSSTVVLTRFQKIRAQHRNLIFLCWPSIKVIKIAIFIRQSSQIKPYQVAMSWKSGWKVEMPTPGWGSIIPRGPHPVEGYGGRELNIQNPRVWGIFLKIPRGFWGVVYWYDVWQ